jgi:hypothetical protein
MNVFHKYNSTWWKSLISWITSAALQENSKKVNIIPKHSETLWNISVTKRKLDDNALWVIVV